MAKQASSVGQKIGKKKRSGRVDFIAQIDDIKAGLAEGWTAKDIWEELKKDKKISISYQMFMRYVEQLITGKKKTDDGPQSTPSIDDQSTTERKVEPSAKPPSPAQPGKASTEQKIDSFEGGPIRGESFDFKEVVRPEAGHKVDDEDLY